MLNTSLLFVNFLCIFIANIKAMKKAVALYRVSTEKQGISTLGLQSQKSSITLYAQQNNYKIENEFVEIESGGNKERASYGSSISLTGLLAKRPVLLQAIQKAKEIGGVLLIKEVTRLTRSSLVYNYLETTGIAFMCTDYPSDNQMMLKMRVLFGEQELLEISRRIKAALSKTTKKIGSPQNLTDDARAKSRTSIKAKALNNINNKKAAGYICTLYSNKKTYAEIAEILNNEGFRTAKDCEFKPTTVMRLYKKYCLPT